MKVLCIKGSKYLIEGEWYELDAKNQFLGNVYLLHNHTIMPWYTSYFRKDKFITLQELRQDKLNKILCQ